MSIQDCSVSVTEDFQVIDPIPTIPPGSTIAQYYETGSKQLAVGVKVYTVTFATAKISTDYIFDELRISNTVDDPSPQFSLTTTTQLTTSFQFVLDAEPTTVNSFLRWAVRINP